MAWMGCGTSSSPRAGASEGLDAFARAKAKSLPVSTSTASAKAAPPNRALATAALNAASLSAPDSSTSRDARAAAFHHLGMGAEASRSASWPLLAASSLGPPGGSGKSAGLS